jgi:hypothetical protein
MLWLEPPIGLPIPLVAERLGGLLLPGVSGAREIRDAIDDPETPAGP